MSNILKYADLHLHSTLRPFINKNYTSDELFSSVWDQRTPTKREADNDMVHFSESDFTSLIQGRVKFAFIALYPIEQGWFTTERSNFILRLLAQIVTRFPGKIIKQFQKDNYNYFELLKKEAHFLLDEMKLTKLFSVDGVSYKFKARIPQNRQELQVYMHEVTTMIVIPTIEGASSILPSNAKNVENIPFEIIASNINYLKNSGYCPFFITLSHHFYNGLCGHAKSFGFENLKMKIVGYFISQEWGITNSISPKGIRVIKKLLGIDEFKGERRILIDIKHMNIDSRIKYFTIIKIHNQDNPDDKIPIIASHVGYSGKTEFLQSKNIKDHLSNKAFTESKSFFNESYINLTNMDVLAIFESEGIIGINLDERIISSKEVIDAGKKINNENELNIYWAKQIIRNITGMAKVIIDSHKFSNEQKSDIWRMFSIGSDFDGFINPLDSYVSTISYPTLKENIMKVLSEDNFFEQYNYGNSASHITELIMGENAKNFLIKYFPE